LQERSRSPADSTGRIREENVALHGYPTAELTDNIGSTFFSRSKVLTVLTLDPMMRPAGRAHSSQPSRLAVTCRAFSQGAVGGKTGAKPWGSDCHTIDSSIIIWGRTSRIAPPPRYRHDRASQDSYPSSGQARARVDDLRLREWFLQILHTASASAHAGLDMSIMIPFDAVLLAWTGIPFSSTTHGRSPKRRRRLKKRWFADDRRPSFAHRHLLQGKSLGPSLLLTASSARTPRAFEEFR